MDRACKTHKEKRNAYRNFVGKPEVQKPLGRSRRQWEDNMKMNLKRERENEVVWTRLIWLRIGTNGGFL
jgi:hypothetical protein